MTPLERRLDALTIEAATADRPRLGPPPSARAKCACRCCHPLLYEASPPIRRPAPKRRPLPAPARSAPAGTERSAWERCVCACCDLDRRMYEDAGEAARPARRQTSRRAAGRQLPGWHGWTPAVSLSRIDQARADLRRGRPVPLALRPFLATGPQVYRISRAGIDRDRPLSIGMTKRSNSIGQRVIEHLRQPSRADPRVHQAIRNLQPGQILVQAARFGRQAMHPRRARLYEGWLQDRERPLLYDPNSTTFEEAGGARRD